MTVKVDGGPVHPAAVAVIEYCTVASMLPVLTRLSRILPVPFAVLPVTLPAVTVELHAKEAPETPEVSVTPALEPEQIVFSDGEFVTAGRGLTVMT